MSMYKVTISVTADQFMDILPHVSGLKIDVKKIDLFSDALAAKLPGPPKTRTPRGSKVNRTILAALANGPQTTKQLKDALEAADLAPGSLSTGLAALQKSGEVSGHGSGIYAVSYQGQKAAAAQ